MLLLNGDCIDEMQKLIDDGVQVDSVVTDPPYHLTSIVKRFGKETSAPAQYGTDGAFKRASTGFMGKEWDGGDIAFRPETWELMLQLLKPGGHLLAFSASRNYHRMAVAIEDAGLIFVTRLCGYMEVVFLRVRILEKQLIRNKVMIEKLLVQ